MPNEIRNEANFDRILDQLAEGFEAGDREKVNKKGMDVFESHLRPKIENLPHEGPTYDPAKHKPGNPRLIDTLIRDKYANGEVRIGFSKKGKKAYIGRLLNDGWDVYNGYGGPYRHKKGAHFWEETEVESKEKVAKAMAEKAQKIIDKKAH